MKKQHILHALLKEIQQDKLNKGKNVHKIPENVSGKRGYCELKTTWPCCVSVSQNCNSKGLLFLWDNILWILSINLIKNNVGIYTVYTHTH